MSSVETSPETETVGPALPNDAWGVIFNFLSLDGIVSAARVCRRWSTLVWETRDSLELEDQDTARCLERCPQLRRLVVEGFIDKAWVTPRTYNLLAYLEVDCLSFHNVVGVLEIPALTYFVLWGGQSPADIPDCLNTLRLPTLKSFAAKFTREMDWFPEGDSFAGALLPALLRFPLEAIDLGFPIPGIASFVKTFESFPNLRMVSSYGMWRQLLSGSPDLVWTQLIQGNLHFAKALHFFDSEGPCNLLVKCVKVGVIGLLEFLLKRLPVDLPNYSNGRTALGQACASSSTREVAALLRFGADVNHRDVFGNTPLELAVRCENCSNVEQGFSQVEGLLAAGAKPPPGRPILFSPNVYTSRNVFEEIVGRFPWTANQFGSYTKFVMLDQPTNTRINLWTTPLVAALFGGHWNALEWLMDHSNQEALDAFLFSTDQRGINALGYFFLLATELSPSGVTLLTRMVALGADPWVEVMSGEQVTHPLLRFLTTLPRSAGHQPLFNAIYARAPPVIPNYKHYSLRNHRVTMLPACASHRLVEFVARIVPGLDPTKDLQAILYAMWAALYRKNSNDVFYILLTLDPTKRRFEDVAPSDIKVDCRWDNLVTDSPDHPVPALFDEVDDPDIWRSLFNAGLTLNTAWRNMTVVSRILGRSLDLESLLPAHRRDQLLKTLPTHLSAASGATVLMKAAYFGHEGNLAFILRHTAPEVVTATDAQGFNAISYLLAAMTPAIEISANFDTAAATFEPEGWQRMLVALRSAGLKFDFACSKPKVGPTAPESPWSRDNSWLFNFRPSQTNQKGKERCWREVMSLAIADLFDSPPSPSRAVDLLYSAMKFGCSFDTISTILSRFFTEEAELYDITAECDPLIFLFHHDDLLLDETQTQVLYDHPKIGRFLRRLHTEEELLATASAKGSTPFIKYMLKRNPKVDTMEAMIGAIRTTQIEALQLLLGSDYFKAEGEGKGILLTLLREAIDNKLILAVRFLLQAGADPNGEFSVFTRPKRPLSLLATATTTDRASLSVIKALIAGGADVKLLAGEDQVQIQSLLLFAKRANASPSPTGVFDPVPSSPTAMRLSKALHRSPSPGLSSESFKFSLPTTGSQTAPTTPPGVFSFGQVATSPSTGASPSVFAPSSPADTPSPIFGGASASPPVFGDSPASSTWQTSPLSFGSVTLPQKTLDVPVFDLSSAFAGLSFPTDPPAPPPGKTRAAGPATPQFG